MTASFSNTLEPKVADNFLSNIDLTEDGCWNWEGYANPDPAFIYHKQARRAQDVAWILTHQTEPEGLAFATLCDNPKCVNPDHLTEIVRQEKAGQAHTLAINNITRNLDVQPREFLYEEHIVEYMGDMKGGADFPPVIVFFDGKLYWLADGFHRVEAAERIGRDSIKAIVKSGTKRDAILFSCGANTTHGIRRTNADKKRAVIRLLKDEEWQRWSNVKLASLSGVSDQTVANYRLELFRETGDEGVAARDTRLMEREGELLEIQVKGGDYDAFREKSQERFEKIVLYQNRLADLVHAAKEVGVVFSESDIIHYAVHNLWRRWSSGEFTFEEANDDSEADVAC